MFLNCLSLVNQINLLTMKTKLTLLIFPVIIMMIISCKGLLDDLLDEGDDDMPEEIADEELLYGKWQAYEFYDDSFRPLGVNNPKSYTDVNQLKELTKYESYEGPCTTKVSVWEKKLEMFEIEILNNFTYSFKYKDINKVNSFDDKCNPKLYDFSTNSNGNLPWSYDRDYRVLMLDFGKNGEMHFQILELNEKEMALNYSDGYMVIKFKKVK